MRTKVRRSRLPTDASVRSSQTGVSSTSLGRAVRRARRDKGYSQRDLGDMVFVDHSVISRIEGGSYNASADLLERISLVLQGFWSIKNTDPENGKDTNG